VESLFAYLMRGKMELNHIEQRKIDEFVRRYKASAGSERIDNSRLVAGSPMYYYCKACGVFITALPEAHFSPAPKYCDACNELHKEALLDQALRVVLDEALRVARKK
jgi:hypothetical protein